MEYHFLGRTGLKVSELCLGAMTFGREADEPTSFNLLDRFIDAGGNIIDTANVYSTGVSEEVLGRWIKGKNRHQLVIATKVNGRMGEGPNERGLSRQHILHQVEASLRRLQTDYIDLYQVHLWDNGPALDETLNTLNSLVQNGKVRYIGASNYAAWQLQKAIDISHQMGWESYSCLQPLYNLLDREAELELIQVCINEGLGVIPWSPLRGGWLSGKYQRGMQKPPSGSRVEKASEFNWSEAWDKYNNEHTWVVIDTLFAMAKELGKTTSQISLRWLMQRPGVTAPIIGVHKMDHLENNLGACGWTLSREQMEVLNKASDKPLPYPYWFINSSLRR
jgi:aryl-alcohol dehydrogenase-like predicted oxidoreductase